MADPSPSATALLHAQAVRWVDTEVYPWVVEVGFEDAAGRHHSLVDKVPLFTFESGDAGPDTALPARVLLTCTILDASRPEVGLRVGIRHRSVNDDGYAEFTVRLDLVREVPRIEFDRVGRITVGPQDGFLVGVRDDSLGTGGYYVYVLNDAVAPTDGGDYWMATLEEVQATLVEWRIEWLGPDHTWPFTSRGRR